MGRKIPKYIPQYFDSPVTLERLTYKASSGSYKATEYLLSLLEFTAIAVLGGDPFVDLTAGDMEIKLTEEYFKHCKSTVENFNPIAMAMNWAWPPIQGKMIVFDYEELMTAVEALCVLLNSVDPIYLVSRLSEKYIKEEFEEREFFELGEAMRCLEVSREVIEKVLCKNPSSKNSEVLKGYDNYENT